MIPPIKSTSSINLQLNSKSKEQKNTELNTSNKILEEPLEWYCNKCANYFNAPATIKYIFDKQENHFVEKKELNCPFCASTDIYNNKAQCFREKLWQKI